MARKNPLDKLAEKALGTIKDPRSTADRLYTQAKGAGSLARQVADRVGRTAVAKASETAGTLAERRAARRASRRGPGLRPVPDVNEPAGPVQDFQRGESAPAAAPEPVAETAAEPVAEPAPSEPAAPAEAGSPATPADVAKAINKNGSPKPAADTGPGDKLPPRKKSEPAKTAKKQASKKSSSTAKKSAASSAKKSAGSTGKKSSKAKKATGGSSGQEQGPPATGS